MHTSNDTLASAIADLGPDAPRVGLVTLGCDKNTVDSERLLARLAGAGARVVEEGADADVIVINTCGFIDVAKEESVDAILDAVRLKQDGRIRAVVAMGCMVQRYKAELTHEIPEVDLFLGLTEAERLVPELRARGLLDDHVQVSTMEQPLRLLTTSTRHTSYLKISEGCDHTCAFCAIPLMRGRHRSTPIDTLVREAQQLEAAGVVELNLISQDTTWYGRDILRGVDTGDAEYFVGKAFAGMAGVTSAAVQAVPRGSTLARDRRTGLLPELLDALVENTSIPWLRLFYMYPSGIYPELVEQIARQPRIVPYIDMPIQHGSDGVLRRMRRPERQATIRERVSWLRDAIPDVALRSTVIVGFPGETDEEFEDMLGLLEEIRFDHLGAFSYSVEEDTAAAQMGSHVAGEIKRERLERLLDLQRGIAQERNEALLGREMVVLVDAHTGRDMDDADAPAVRPGALGRTARQALEIDGTVHIDDATSARPGDFVRVRITDVIETDLRAEILVNTD
ncbi:MAG TPA: 30S ribosomal protein S12 methylthiotransferase RimO [Longimicrobiales bacterium]|nr:30S ribosomal protein S12 methylthiotransferase RimO [Longimicrobiales bacterium]